MLEIGLGEALEVEIRRKKAHYEATEAAIGSAFSKGSVGRVYRNSLDDVLSTVQNSRRNRRGLDPQATPNRDAQELRRMLGSGRRKK